jgi:hypothetical protein
MLLETPLTEVIEHIRSLYQIEDIGGALIKFQKMGLIDFSWKGGRRINIGNEFSISPTAASPLILSYNGLVSDGGAGDVQMAPIAARQFSYSGTTLVFINIVIENTWEDLVGGIENEQWALCGHRLREMVRSVCLLALCASGLAPRPPIEDVYDDLVYYFLNSPGVDPDLQNAIRDLGPIRIRNRQEAEAVSEKLRAVVKQAKQLINCDIFPTCFESEQQWQEALDMGYDWVRLSAYLDSDFPIEEARDLLSTGGAQPHLA